MYSLGFAAKGLQPVRPRRGFQRARRRRADRDHPPAARLRGQDRIDRRLRHLAPLAVDRVLRRVVDLHRRKRPQPDVQRHARRPDAARREPVEHFRREVQPGGRRRDRPAALGVHGLVAFASASSSRPLRMYGGSGMCPYRASNSVGVPASPVPSASAGRAVRPRSVSRRPVSVTNTVRRARDARASGRASPTARPARRGTAPPTSRRSLRGGRRAAPAAPSCRSGRAGRRARAVRAGRGSPVFEGAAVAAHDEQPRFVAPRGRVLGDQVFGQVVVEEVHGRVRQESESRSQRDQNTPICNCADSWL